MLSRWHTEKPCAADEIFGTTDTDRRIARRITRRITRRARVAPAGAVLS